MANRVIEIQNNTDLSRWSYCCTEDNPADMLTRGITARDLVKAVWVNGPNLLSSSKDEWPFMLTCRSMLTCSDSEVLVSFVEPNAAFDVRSCGKFSKAISVVAWVLRFVYNPRRTKNPDTLVHVGDLLSFTKGIKYS